MKKFLKVLSAFAVISLIAASTTTVNAATKEELLAYAKDAHKVAGKEVTLTSAQLVELERYLGTTELTEAEMDTVIANADKVVATMTAEGVSDATKLSATKKEEVLGYVTAAANAAKLSVKVDTVNNSLALFDSTGKAVDVVSFNNDGKLVFTGTQSLSVATVAVMFALALASIVAMKKGLLSVEK